ncbi:Sec-independent protein translocase protein TatB [Aeromonas veronii]|uniref:Sec-independent protein translocase protein TatB n=1 Tax=Aeromonas veronii TaxID=654 RepID=UPI00226C70AC|nr:Sec-independent protein translocase protein TatB [Aeromonas veronii]MCX9134855.1 Sec-independent protein translocase protein TatB [Aeromonas veronii]
MFDIGFWELVLIGIIALVVLGPERLPHALRAVSYWLGVARVTAARIKTELSLDATVQELSADIVQLSHEARGGGDKILSEISHENNEETSYRVNCIERQESEIKVNTFGGEVADSDNTQNDKDIDKLIGSNDKEGGG